MEDAGLRPAEDEFGQEALEGDRAVGERQVEPVRCRPSAVSAPGPPSPRIPGRPGWPGPDTLRSRHSDARQDRLPSRPAQRRFSRLGVLAGKPAADGEPARPDPARHAEIERLPGGLDRRGVLVVAGDPAAWVSADPPVRRDGPVGNAVGRRSRPPRSMRPRDRRPAPIDGCEPRGRNARTPWPRRRRRRGPCPSSCDRTADSGRRSGGARPPGVRTV